LRATPGATARALRRSEVRSPSLITPTKGKSLDSTRTCDRISHELPCDMDFSNTRGSVGARGNPGLYLGGGLEASHLLVRRSRDYRRNHRLNAGGMTCRISPKSVAKALPWVTLPPMQASLITSSRRL